MSGAEPVSVQNMHVIWEHLVKLGTNKVSLPQLWGNPNHMKSVAKALRETYSEDELYLLVAKRNSDSFTYDGIERGGERVCLEIEEELEKVRNKGGKITKLSIVGYSLGGLVARYAIGLLEMRGILREVEPVVWIPFFNLTRSLYPLLTIAIS